MVGGDFSENRLIPDIIRSVLNGAQLDIRNPKSTRPWQHVLDPLSGYLRLAENIYDSKSGWDEGLELWAEPKFCFFGKPNIELFDPGKADRTRCIISATPKYHEEILLHLDFQKSANLLGVSEVWGIRDALDKTINWYFAQNEGSDMYKFSQDQVDENISSQSDGYKNSMTEISRNEILEIVRACRRKLCFQTF